MGWPCGLGEGGATPEGPPHYISYYTTASENTRFSQTPRTVTNKITRSVVVQTRDFLHLHNPNLIVFLSVQGCRIVWLFGKEGKPNQKKRENQAPKRVGKKGLPSGQQVEKYRYLPYLQNAPSSHTPATTRRLSLRTLLCLLAACASHPFKAIHPKFTPEKERFRLE